MLCDTDSACCFLLLYSDKEADLAASTKWGYSGQMLARKGVKGAREGTWCRPQAEADAGYHHWPQTHLGHP